MKYARYFLVAAIITPLFVSGFVGAQAARTENQQNSSTAPANGAQSQQERSQRLQNRKEQATRRFTVIEQNVVQSRCRSAQGLISSTSSRIKSFEAQRTTVYANLVRRLVDIDTKLSAAGTDTIQFSQSVKNLQTKVDEYTTEFTNFSLALSDLAAMDCSSDPEAFAATLFEAQAMRSSVVTKGKEIRALLKDSVKPAFLAAKSELSSKRTGEGQ